jgi:hypothetical protein
MLCKLSRIYDSFCAWLEEVGSSVFYSSGILFGELEEEISASKRYGKSKLYPFDFMKKIAFL